MHKRTHQHKPTLEARQQFENARFGLFIHWGVFSILGDAEWVMQNENIKVQGLYKADAFLQSYAIQCTRLGEHGKKCRNEIHYFNYAPS